MRPRMQMFSFYCRVRKRVFKGWWGIARAIGFFVALLLALWRYLINPAVQLPLSADIVLLLCVAAAIFWVLLRTPYLMYADEKHRADGLQERLTPRLSASHQNSVKVSSLSGFYS
jgi:hypothetical protein